METVEKPILLGELVADTGRLQNKLWAYFVPRTQSITGWQAECDVEPLTVSREDLKERINDGSFDHVLHVALSASPL